MTFRPLSTYMALRIDPFPEMVGMIQIPQAYIEKAARNQDGPVTTGVVVSVGPGDRGKHGARIHCDVVPGERVAFPKHGMSQFVESDGEQLLVMNEQFVYGVVPASVEVRGLKSWSEAGIGNITSETIKG